VKAVFEEVGKEPRRKRALEAAESREVAPQHLA